MKKFFALFACVFVFAFLLSKSVFAQSAKIIDVRGKTLVKKTASDSWERAKINMLLGNEAEVKTQERCQCVLAFDEEQKNLLTIKENSHIKIESVRPGNVSLSEGRVFSLISNLAKLEKFEIRTPVAIAGARGTAWGTAHGSGATNIEVFDDVVSVQGLDGQGQSTGEKDVPGGFGMEVGQGGLLGDLMPLGNTNSQDLNDLKNMGGGSEQFGSGDGQGDGDLGDLKNEGGSTLGDLGSENLRRLEEERLNAPVEPPA
ncbi:MAG: FecR family protein [Candidatus Omnitrophota bacterium]